MNYMKSNADSVRLLGAVALAVNGDCTRKVLLDAILKWRQFQKMVKREAEGELA
jgi:hypothetical protein